jgi:hypothetical protein
LLPRLSLDLPHREGSSSASAGGKDSPDPTFWVTRKRFGWREYSSLTELEGAGPASPSTASYADLFEPCAAALDSMPYSGRGRRGSGMRRLPAAAVTDPVGGKLQAALPWLRAPPQGPAELIPAVVDTN